ncbi:MAG: phospho-N-acetylmuramoyl-pentapeptide-transferase [Patescibacteria group bacterium]
MTILLLEAIKVLTLSMVAFIIALAITPVVANMLTRMKAGKQIRASGETPIYTRLHSAKAGTPTMGGIIVWGTVALLAFIIFIFHAIFDGFWSYINFIDRAETYLPFAAMILAGTIGLIDDALGILRIGPNNGGISVRQKLVAYFLIAVIGALWFYYRLDWDTLTIPLVGSISIGWLYIPLFIFVIVASAFSANETDGLDGLAGGVMLFAFIALTIVAFALGRYHLATFGGVTIGALLAFLWHNIYPARFFMGDTGSMALGITMGMIAMFTNTTLLLPFFAPILVLESLSVVIQIASKKWRGKKVFLSTPIHHHFEALGWHETRITMRFWIISAIASIFGLAIFFLDRLL